MAKKLSVADIDKELAQIKNAVGALSDSTIISMIQDLRRRIGKA